MPSGAVPWAPCQPQLVLRHDVITRLADRRPACEEGRWPQYILLAPPPLEWPRAGRNGELGRAQPARSAALALLGKRGVPLHNPQHFPKRVVPRQSPYSPNRAATSPPGQLVNSRIESLLPGCTCTCTLLAEPSYVSTSPPALMAAMPFLRAAGGLHPPHPASKWMARHAWPWRSRAPHSTSWQAAWARRKRLGQAEAHAHMQ